MADAIVSVVLQNLIDLAKDQVVLLLGFKKELGKINSKFQKIRSLLEDAERRQIQDKSVKDWLIKLEEAAYEMDDLLEEWMVKSHRTLHPAAGRGSLVRNSLLPVLSYIKLIILRRKYGSKLCVMREKLDEIAKENDQFKFGDMKTEERADRSTSTFGDEESVVGRDRDKEILVKRLTDCDQHVSVISIVGMGGLGKTTLAQLLYKDQRVKVHFQSHLWICVSDDFNVSEIVRKIVEDGGGNCSGVKDLNPRAKILVEMLQGKRFILILDDVWNEDSSKWEQLKNFLNCGANGSKIVVTTRKTEVARIMRSNYKHHLGELSNDECWLIFERMALSGRTNVEEGLKEIGEEIVRKCKGLPLAVKIMANMLRDKSKKNWEDVRGSEVWSLDKYDSDVVPVLKLSYIDLPPHLRMCFRYCSMYPKDWVMKKHELVRMWVVQGYVVVKDRDGREVEDIGEEYFDELLGRSLFQEPQEDKYEKGNVISCKMHDLVHDFAKSVTRRECESFDISETGVVESSSRLVGDNILHCRLIWDYRRKEDAFPFANWLSGGRNLRTLVLHWPPKLLHLDLKISRLQSLRVLSLFGCGISEDKLEALGELIHIRHLDLGKCTNIKSLPRSIDKLELLTYLNLSWTQIRELPEWITDLHLLRLVDLNYCLDLEKLPERMYQLVGLRHLDIKNTRKLKNWPAKKIGTLSQLRTLSKFIVAARAEEDGRSSSSIGELKDLNLLRGYLEITNLENVVGRADAYAAKLEEKCSLSQLELKWTRDEEVLNGGDIDEEVLEGLCPPRGLVRLKIEGYGGGRFAGWMDSQQGEVINCSKPSNSVTTPSPGILSHLQELRLYSCPSVSQLPRGLGLLPRLKKLTISGLRGVKKVGSMELFGGWGGDHHGVPAPAAGFGFFPHLEELIFAGMEDLEGWDVPPLMLLTTPKVDEVEASGGSDPQLAAPMMPRLRYLALDNCPKLQALPPIFTTSLRQLYLQNTPLINMRFFPPQGIESIELYEMPTRRLLMDLPNCLKYLSISSDDDLTELPVDDLLRLASLQELSISNCPNLKTLPEEMSRLRGLEVLYIFKCPKLGDKCREGGLLWPTIRHIPTICINGRIIKERNKMLEL